MVQTNDRASVTRLPVCFYFYNMYTKVYFMLVSLLFLAARGDPDPQTFIASTPGPLYASPSQQPQYEEKNIVVYLTPEQITALQTGQGVLEPVLESQPQTEEEQQNEEQLPQFEDNNFELAQGFDQQNDFLGNQRFVILQNQREQEPAPVKEPSQEEPQGLSQYASGGNKYKAPDSERNKYRAPTPKQQENKRYYATSTEKPEERKDYAATSEKQRELDLKSYNYYSVYNEKKGDNINIKIIHPNTKLREVLGLKESETQKAPVQNKRYKFVPYAYVNEKQPTVEPIQKSNQRSRTAEKSNERQYTILYTPTQSEEKQESQEYEQEDSSESVDDELNESKYEGRQNERKKILDLLKKQNTQTETANVGKLPVIIKKVSITKQVPVPQPYIVRVPQPVPVEIIKHVPIEIENNEKEDEKQTYKIEKTVRVPATKKVYVKVDKPILVERIVSVENRRGVQAKPQKLRILGPTWKYYD